MPRLDSTPILQDNFLLLVLLLLLFLLLLLLLLLGRFLFGPLLCNHCCRLRRLLVLSLVQCGVQYYSFRDNLVMQMPCDVLCFFLVYTTDISCSKLRTFFARRSSLIISTSARGLVPAPPPPPPPPPLASAAALTASTGFCWSEKQPT